MPTAYQFQDVAGHAVLHDADSFPQATNQIGTSQVVRVSFDASGLGSGEDVSIPVTATGSALVSDGTSTPSAMLSLHITDAAPVATLVVSDPGGAENYSVTLGSSSSNLGSGSFDGVAAATLNFVNHGNAGGAGNAAPTDPTLKSPAQGQSVDASGAVEFEWAHAYDADHDPLQYHLCFSSSSAMTGMQCMSVGEEAIVPGSGVASPGIFFVLVVLLALGARRRWDFVTTTLPLATMFLLGASCVSSCGSQHLIDVLQSPARPSVKASVPANTLLRSGTTYWRVFADDGKGGVTASSETRSLEVH